MPGELPRANDFVIDPEPRGFSSAYLPAGYERLLPHPVEASWSAPGGWHIASVDDVYVARCEPQDICFVANTMFEAVEGAVEQLRPSLWETLDGSWELEGAT